MTHIIFQQEAEIGLAAPWSILFLGGEIIYGRPDATALIGFSPEVDPAGQVGTMTAAIQVKDPAELIGQYPIFTDAGHMFTDTRKITEARIWDGDAAGAQRLRESMAEQRKALEAAGAVASTWTVVGMGADDFQDEYPVAAIRGHVEPSLNAESWVVYVQSLNAQEAMEKARIEREADAYIAEQEAL